CDARRSRGGASLVDGQLGRPQSSRHRPRPVAPRLRLRCGSRAAPVFLRLPRPPPRAGGRPRGQRRGLAYRRVDGLRRIRARAFRPLSRRLVRRRGEALRREGGMAAALAFGTRVSAACARVVALMFGPRIEGKNGIALVPPTMEDYKRLSRAMLQPEIGRFWGPRFGDFSDETQEKRYKEGAETRSSGSRQSR